MRHRRGPARLRRRGFGPHRPLVFELGDLVAMGGGCGDADLGQELLHPADGDQVGCVVAHGEDDEVDSGVEAEPPPELDVEGVASDDVATGGRVLGGDFGDSVDSSPRRRTSSS